MCEAAWWLLATNVVVLALFVIEHFMRVEAEIEAEQASNQIAQLARLVQIKAQESYIEGFMEGEAYSDEFEEKAREEGLLD